MATIATLGTSLTAKTGNFEKGFKKAKRIAANFSSDLAKHTRTIAAYGAATVGVAAYATSRLVKEQLSAVDATSKLSRVVGLTTEELVGYQHAMNLAGGDSEGFEKSVVRMNRTIADAANGLSTAKREIDAVGLSVEQLAGMSTDNRIKLLADRYNSIGDASKRASFLMNVFGRSGLAMGSLFEQGAEGIAKAQQEAEDLGLTFSDLDGRQVEEANDAITRMQKVITGAATRIAVQLAPYILVAANRLREFAQGWNVSGEAANNAFNSMAESLGGILNVVDIIRGTWSAFMAGVYASVGALLQVSNVIAQILDKMGELLGIDSMNGFGEAFDEFADSFTDAAVAAAKESEEAFGRVFSGENMNKAKTFFKGIQIEAAKVSAELEEGAVRDVKDEEGAASAKSTEFRQVDLDRVFIGKSTGGGTSQITKGEEKIVDEQRKTNSYLSVLVKRPLIA